MNAFISTGAHTLKEAEKKKIKTGPKTYSSAKRGCVL